MENLPQIKVVFFVVVEAIRGLEKTPRSSEGECGMFYTAPSKVDLKGKLNRMAAQDEMFQQ